MKILITQTASLGDVILSTPVINALRRIYPQAEIWFLSTTPGTELLKLDPELSGLISFDKRGKDRGFFGLLKKAAEIRKQKFDFCFAIQRSARVSILLWLSGISKRIGFNSSALPFLFTQTVNRVKNAHDVDRNLSILSTQSEVLDSDKELRLFAPKSDVISKELLKELREPYIAIFPGSLWYTKRWQAKNFAELAHRLLSAGMAPIFFGSSQEKELADNCALESGCKSLAAKTNLQDLLFIIANAKAVVCNDSSALHIASAFKIATTAVFCATTPQFGFGPWHNPNCQIIEESNLWCRPCSRHGGTYCPTGSEACMRGRSKTEGVAVQAVLDSVLLLSGGFKKSGINV